MSQSSAGDPPNGCSGSEQERRAARAECIRIAADADEHDILKGHAFGTRVAALQGRYGAAEVESLANEMKERRLRWGSKSSATSWAKVARTFSEDDVKDLIRRGVDATQVQVLATVHEKHRRDELISHAAGEIGKKPSVRELKSLVKGKQLPESNNATKVPVEQTAQAYVTARIKTAEKLVCRAIGEVHEVRWLEVPPGSFGELNKLLEDCAGEVDQAEGGRGGQAVETSEIAEEMQDTSTIHATND